MPWKLIFFLFILTLVVFFAGFNITNTATISFGFYTFSDIPVFVSLFIAYLLGALTTLPFVMLSNRKKKNKQTQQELPSGGASKKQKKKRKKESPLPELEAGPGNSNNDTEGDPPIFK